MPMVTAQARNIELTLGPTEAESKKMAFDRNMGLTRPRKSSPWTGRGPEPNWPCLVVKQAACSFSSHRLDLPRRNRGRAWCGHTSLISANVSVFLNEEGDYGIDVTSQTNDGARFGFGFGLALPPSASSCLNPSFPKQNPILSSNCKKKEGSGEKEPRADERQKQRRRGKEEQRWVCFQTE